MEEKYQAEFQARLEDERARLREREEEGARRKEALERQRREEEVERMEAEEQAKIDLEEKIRRWAGTCFFANLYLPRHSALEMT